MALPVFNTTQIIEQLTTSWGGFDEGTTRTWNANTIFYSIPTTSPDFTFPYTFSALFNPTTRELARQAFELWDDLIAPHLTETTDKNEQITLAWSSTGFDEGVLGAAHTDKHAFFSSDYQIDQSRVWINANSVVPQILDEVGVGGIWTFLHEIGHALGLSHPGSYNDVGQSYDTDAEYAQDTYQFSVMSYFDETNFGNADYFNPDDTSSFINTPSTPMLHDVLAIQAKYGADPNTRTGDTMYGFSSNAGRTAFDFSVNVDPVITIYDAGGSDTLNCSGYSHDQNISLVPGNYSSIGALTNNVAIAFNTVIENAIGGSGDDQIFGNDATNVLDGGAGDDVLVGGGGDGMLGGQGADVLDASASKDSSLPAVLSGGELGDTYIVGKATDIVLEDDIFGHDWVIAVGTSYTLPANVEDLTLLPDGSHANFVGTGNAENNRIEGNGDANTLLGLDGRDHLLGFDGNDDLTGGLGADNLEGGPGLDRFIFLSGSDVTLDPHGPETIDGGTNIGGFDALILKNTGSIDFGQTLLNDIEAVQFFSGTSTASFNADQIGTVGISRVTGNAASVDTLVVNGSTTNLSTLTFLTWTANDVVILKGTGNGETLTGSSQNDTLNGFGGGDTLNGGAGDDILNGGPGGDQLNGGTGTGSIDTASYADAAAGANGVGVTANLLDSSQNSGEAAGDKYISIENLLGSAFDDTLVGTAGANTISGGGGDDMLVGGSGADVLDGGPGNDAFIFRSGSDVVAGESISGGSGFDALVLENAGSINFGSSPLSSIEVLQFASGTSIANFTAGNGAIGILVGNAASVDTVVINSITSLDLTRVIFSTWAANDVIILNGTGGADTITGTDQSDTINGFGSGDTLDGGDSNDVLDGGPGSDTLIGGPGSDILNGGGDSDTASYSTASAGITARLDLGFGLDDGAEFDNYTSIENVTGSDFADVLVGKAGEANILSGGLDDDTFIGEGIDTVIGGAGSDVFFGGQGSALNINLATSSIETVWGSFVGDVMNGSTATTSLTMVGQGLTGGANADTMTGGSGNDFIYFRAGDVINGGAGNDWAVATLSASGVTLNLTATGFENAWGSTSNDSITAASSATTAVIVGDAGNDTLTGGNAGDFLYGFGDNDTLTGNGGNDNLVGGAGTDTFVFGANWGTDIVWDWQDGAEHFNMQGSGAANFAALAVNQNFSGSGNALISFGINQILVVGGANHIDGGDFIF